MKNLNHENQLFLFKVIPTETEKMGEEVGKLQKKIDYMRNGMFKRHGELFEEMTKVQEDIEKLKKSLEGIQLILNLKTQ